MSAEESDIFVVLSFHLLRVFFDDSAGHLLAVSYKLLLKVEISSLFTASFNIKVFTADSLIKAVSCRHLLAE